MTLNISSLLYLTGYTLLGRLCIKGEIQNKYEIILATKPLLMPCLIQVIRPIMKRYCNDKDQSKGLYLLTIALVFAFFGDIFLLPCSDDKEVSEEGFILGLLSFLIMQIIYINIFNSVNGIGIVSKNRLLVIPYLLLYIGVNYIINPYVDDLFVPVLVYSACLIYMAICSLNLIGKIPFQYALTITIGSLVFAISDAIIAFQKFKLIESSTLAQGILFSFFSFIYQLF